MGKNFTIISDSTCDLPKKYYDENNIVMVPFVYNIDEVEYDGTFENSLNIHEFYEKLKVGSMSKTAQISPLQYRTIFEPELKKGNDILYLGFSSGLSGSFHNSTLAKEELEEEYDNKIICIDTLAASLGQGLILDYAVKMKNEGLSVDEVANAVNNIILKTCHYFTVDDLNHLYRGGRVSKVSALLGTMLGIKPVLHVDEEGHLIPIGKVRGRKQSLDALVQKMDSKLAEYNNPYVFISHGDCENDAKYVEEQVKKQFGIEAKIINTIGPVIGTHSGPGTVALFFIGSDRHEKKM